MRHRDLKGPAGNRRLVRRPRAGLVTPHSGCVGAPPGTTTGPCEELADGGADEACETLGPSDDPKGVAKSEPEAG